METPPTVLLIDDNPKLIKLFHEALSELTDFNIQVAMDGIAGLERIYELQPTVAVIDVKMPGLDGNQLVRTIRGDPDTASLPLIIMTAMAQEKDILLGMVSGVDVYLTKPVLPSELIAAIQKVVGLTASDRAHRMKRLVEEMQAGNS